jgi:two-component system response regulator HydG
MDEGRAAILIVADDDSLRAELVHQLVGHGHGLQVVGDPEEALERLAADRPHLMIVALRPGRSLPLLERARAMCGRTTALIAVAKGAQAARLSEALRHGADHGLSLPEQADALAPMVERALEKPELAREVERARDGILDGLSLSKIESIVGAHPVMQRLMSKVVQAAQSRATVLIHGETGTGKELIAAAVHQHSKRKDGQFVKLNCAALADTVLESELFGHEKGAFTGAAGRRKGRFEQADGGTLFLDEVSEINPAVQVKLLRFLQEREFERVGGNVTVRVDVRIVAATNRDLLQLVEDGRFREDLYYRLNVVRLDVPPLRARPSDISLLTGHFLRRFAEENEKEIYGLTPEASDALLAHPWPGNVRELENAIEQAVVLCESEMVHVEDLPISPAEPAKDPLKLMIPGVSMAELERYAILRTLEGCGGSPSKAATMLGISRRTIQYRLQEWGMSRPGKSGRGEATDASAGSDGESNGASADAASDLADDASDDGASDEAERPHARGGHGIGFDDRN